MPFPILAELSLRNLQNIINDADHIRKLMNRAPWIRLGNNRLCSVPNGMLKKQRQATSNNRVMVVQMSSYVTSLKRTRA